MKPKRYFFRSTQLFGSPLRYGAPVFAGFVVLVSGLNADAGDILRGGGSSSTGTPSAGTSAGTPTPAATDAARANARDTLARTTQTLTAMRAMQTAARNAAISGANHLGNNPNNPGIQLPTIPNGLATGGLQVAPSVTTDPTKWTGANLPTQTVSGANTTVTIKQTTQQALLNWQTFNVGKETTVTFDQTAAGENSAQWIAFNKITDPTGNPTQILGSIKADGQIYIINQNGIIFGGSSQVNARGLTVSSLPINTNLVSQGLLNNPDAQFQFSGLAMPSGLNGTEAFTPDSPISPDGKYGDVIVQSGAVLESPTNAAKIGGRITLVGPNVVNQGTILTPDGQTILASGLQVGFDGHASSDPSLRGLDVFVGAVADPVAGLYAGTTTQNGVIEAPRGSITIAGREINQNGGLVSTTSVSLNGRVDIQANYNAISNRATANARGDLFLFKSSGSVSLGAGSLISILPEYDSKETTIGTELALRSQINIDGRTVRVGEGSILVAPSASVNLSAGSWFFDSASAAPTSTFVQSGGQVYVEEEALIDVSGSLAVPVSVSQNIVSVDLRSSELADSPLQRLGLLRNATVQVDIRDKGDGWIGTPLADVSGFANLIQRSVGQLTVAGGSVTISAGDSVVMQEGSNIDVSGGSTLFESGMIRTTQLMTGGHLVDIGNASPEVIYDGIYDGSFDASNDKFGVSNVYNGVLAPAGYRYEEGYTEGASGGKLSISASSMALDGGFSGSTVVGEKQRLTPPTRSSLTLSFQSQDITYPGFPLHSTAPPTITFDPMVSQTAAAPFAVDANGNSLDLQADRKSLVVLSPELLAADGFGTLTVNNHDGDIIVSEGVDLAAPTGGSITFNASNITINGSVTARGGLLSFATYGLTLDEINLIQYSLTAGTPPAVPQGRGVFTLGSTGRLSTAGLVVDDRLSSGIPTVSPTLLNGGTIKVEGYSANLAEGGMIDVSGGASLSARGAVGYGNGGSLTISAGREIGFNATLGGQLTLGSEMLGLSGPKKSQGVAFPKAKASSLSLTGPAFQVGGDVSDSAITLIQPDFFSKGGFGNISLTGIGLATSQHDVFVPGVTIAENAQIKPVAEGWLASVDENNMFGLSGIVRDEGERHAVNLSFGAIGASYNGILLVRGDVVAGEGSSIDIDAKGSISFKGQTTTLRGTLIASGGSVSVTGNIEYPLAEGQIPTLALPTVHLASTANLSTAGRTILDNNAYGLRQGEILAGGNIAITGNILAESGAVIDVSGTRGTLDLPISSSALDSPSNISSQGMAYVPVTIDSNGGTITLTGSKLLCSDATLLGKAGGTSANGGTLSVSSGRFIPDATAYTTADANLIVTQNARSVADTNSSAGVGAAVLDANGNIAPQLGYFSVDRFSEGGFDSLSLRGNVRFDGQVSIAVPGSLKVADGGVIYANDHVTLAAAHVALGQAFRTPTQQAGVELFTKGVTKTADLSTYYFGPTHGAGMLTVNAKLIDIGDLALQGIGKAAFHAPSGDIRGNGTLQIAGDLTFEAGQIYPPTQRQFNVFAYDYVSAGAAHKGSVTVLGGDTRSLPLSAGGTLSIYASEITQGGTLRAPVGTINLGWDGSGTAPFNPIAGTTLANPVTSLLTLAAGGVTSVSTVDPITGKTTVIPYGISLDGKSWIDPAGNDITVSGPPGKSVKLAAINLVTEADSTVDISGGGDLHAYRWISGNGGSEDILSSSNSFAVIPGYGFDYSPYAPFNSDSSATNLGGASGYVNSSLKVGDQITLSASKDLPAGTYTLLPARYALLPGAVLVTPKSTVPSITVNSPDGSSLVSGYRSNNLDTSRTGQTLIGGFEIASAKVFRARAEYQDLLANTVLREAAISREFTVPRLPVDAGHLSFSSTTSMTLLGSVSSIAPTYGRGSVIDINSASDILINSSGTGNSGAGLVLSAQTLNSFGAESLLVGGLRSFDSEGTSVTANSAKVTLDNAGTALTGKDIILVSREELTLGENSEITSTEDDIALDTLSLGNTDTAGSGNGSLVRVSANATGQVSRFGISSSSLPELTILAGAGLTGGNIVLDSTAATNLSESARLIADDVSLNSGQISISLNNPGILNPTTGLVLAGDALSSLQDSAKRLALLSYSTIDVYGSGTVGSQTFESLSLQASAIRGFNMNGGSTTFTAAKLSLGNSAASHAPSSLAGTLSGSVTFDANQISLGANGIRLDGYAQATLSGTGGILTYNKGTLDTIGDLSLITPLLTGASASKYQIRSTGALQLTRPAGGGTSNPISAFGADLTLQGSSVKVNGDITLPSGNLTLHATSGDLTLGDSTSANLNLAGTSTTFVDSIRYTSGGTVNLFSDTGSVRINTAAAINVSARNGGGNAGTVRVQASGGTFDLNGSITGTAGTEGTKGEFSLDAGVIAGGSLADLDTILNTGSFLQSRDYRIRTGNVNIDGLARSHIYRVAADSGNILVSNTIDASGVTGGTIDLKAHGSLTLGNGSLLNAVGTQFDAAGKGGDISLEAGSQRNGVLDSGAMLDLQSGSTIKLSVAAANTSSESLGMFTGTLHLRAPRNTANTDLQLSAIGSSIEGASSILVEGVKLYGLTGTGTITTAVQTSIKADAIHFLGAAGTTTAGYSAMLGRLTSIQPALDLILAPGAEIFNTSGDLVLGTTSSTATSDWNLETFRFGAKSAAGVLTLRASGDLVFHNALSDGFAAVTPNANNGQSSLWLAPLMARNELLPANSQSWSYRFTSGADLSSADFRAVLPESSLATSKGSFLLGKNYGNAATYGSGANFTTSTAIANRYQVIRTGSGDITINSGRNAYILNQFSSIYSAGTVVSNPTSVVSAGDFVVPLLLSDTGRHPTQGSLLGAIQQQYFVQYSMAGGDVSIHAANDIARMTRNTSSSTGGTLIDDSSRQLPNNWLYRRGYIDPATGASGIAGVDDGGASLTDPNASTTWWIDFSNFFEGVGALGGGNISLSAGNDVKNVDALAPTNARMPSGTPSAANMVELGGGDVTVIAGRNIDGGVYYVERGSGVLEAGGQITTNATRSPSRGTLASLTSPLLFDSNTWLPTTLFVGKGGFDVQAAGDLLLGPVANAFLLPQGINNKFWYKTYFSTYAPDSYVNVTSLGGGVTHRTEVSLPTEAAERPLLGAWTYAHQSLSTSQGAAVFQPWLRLAETTTSSFNSLFKLMVPNLRTTSFGGGINLAGDITLFPSSMGQIELLARDSINGLQPSGFNNNLGVQRWITSTVNVSDADPTSIPGITSPYAYLQVVGRAASAQRVTESGLGAGFLAPLDDKFSETGSSSGSLEKEQARHTPGGLHLGDSEPVRVFAVNGNIDGFNLFTPKAARVIAGMDIGDISFYFQNLSATDLSIVSAGRDVIPYNASTISRSIANSSIASNSTIQLPLLAGDIQIAGPGNLQVLAGRNLDLGLGSGNSDGTGVGITSIGNGRNPYLPFDGASLTVGAGIGPASSLSGSSLTFNPFITDFVETDAGKKHLETIAPGIDFSSLSEEEQAILALEVFYLTLRDTGRDFNDPDSPGYRKYDNGFAAIKALFPESTSWEGEILTQSRDIRTRSGGDISIFAPGGGLTMANTTIGNPLTPPGIVTESGGDISIFTNQSVNIGIGRIFTLRGGNAAIWSSKGDIAAGSSSRTISAAPPTRVIIDPQSASVETDLAGLATGGGIGVLATVEGVEPGDVDLIAPAGIIDAGDAGIRVSGNINLAAVTVVNSGNISAGGTSTGAPSASVSAPSISTVTSASNATAAAGSTVAKPGEGQKTGETAATHDEAPSIFTVEVIGYGGGGATDEEDEEEKEQAQ